MQMRLRIEFSALDVDLPVVPHLVQFWILLTRHARQSEGLPDSSPRPGAQNHPGCLDTRIVAEAGDVLPESG